MEIPVPADTPFEVSVISETPEVVVLKMSGEILLDAREAEIELNRLAARRNALTVLDLSGLSFISSLGMGLLVGLNNGIKRQGRQLRLVAVQPMVLTALKRMRLDEIFKFRESVEQALAG